MAKSPSADDSRPSGTDAISAFIAELQTLPMGDHVIRGMVKPAETTDGVMFTHEGHCDDWVYIPASAMKAVRAAGFVRCDTHSHMVAEIQLIDPDDELGRTFASLGKLHQMKIANLHASIQSGLCNSNSDCLPGQHCGPDGNGGKKCLPGPF